MRYERPEPGTWVQPVPEGYKMQCCDCGLVHRMDFRIVEVVEEPHETLQKHGASLGLHVQFQVARDERATAATRRERRKRGEAWYVTGRS